MADSVPLRSTQSGGRATFQNSEFPLGIHRQPEDADAQEQLMLSSSGRGTTNFTSSRQTEVKMIAAVDLDDSNPPEHKSDYKGRIKTWPGILLLIGILGAGVALVTLGAINAHTKSNERAVEYEYNVAHGRKIQDGLNSSGDLIDEDGQVGNPKKYPSMGCELPDYQSKNGQIFAVSKNGTEVAVGIKGVNWFGMETGMAVPFGLWENQDNGTTAYEIASFLARNKFNSVRLPLCIKSILGVGGIKPSKDLVNMNSNRALNITSYMGLVQSLVKVLAYRQVSVMISLHTLDTKTSGGAWYSEKLGVSEDEFLDAVDIVTSSLCGAEYWNVIGVDLKNEPHECTWGSGVLDWQKGATLIGNRVIKGCPNWLAFVEGVNGVHPITTTNRKGTYYDWWGGGLQNAGKDPVVLKVENKVVYAPHYYNTGVTPAWYLYKSGVGGPQNTMTDYVELDDATLKLNVKATMEDMFGYLAASRKEAVVLGEFAGLYGKDEHPKLTTKRTTDFTIEAAIEQGLAGGYMWSLNPESAYQFNPADTYGHFTEGLLTDDWLTPNKVFLEGMAALDKVQSLKMFPCFPQENKE